MKEIVWGKNTKATNLFKWFADIAIFIDEVQHNDFITPELLKHIKNSKFVVVDLTHQNNVIAPPIASYVTAYVISVG